MPTARRLGRHIAWILACLLMVCPAPAVSGTASSSATDRIEAALRHTGLTGADLGVEIRSLTTGEIRFSRNAHRPLIVASNNKIVTTAAALHHLGPEGRLRTRLYARGERSGDRLEGDLVLRGGGDPCLSERFYGSDPTAPLDGLARAVVEAGIRRVAGMLVVDDTLFDREFIAPGWPRDQLDHRYCAPVAGVSYMENLVGVEVTPARAAGNHARAVLFPEDAPFRLEDRVLTTTRRGENVIHLARPSADGVIRITGRTWKGNGPSRYFVPVRDPPAYFGACLLAALRRAGVKVAGGVGIAAAPFSYAGMHLLGTVEHTVVDAVTVTNKESQNHFAEQLFKLAGWKVAGKGTFATGAAAVRKMFEDLGVEGDPFTMVDGSGLSRGNTFSPHTLVSLLEKLYRSPLRDPFIRSLPIAGVDGTLENRLREAPYRFRVRAKTGWIREVSALTGYVQALDGEIFAFSILFNGYRGSNASMKAVQDRICRILVSG